MSYKIKLDSYTKNVVTYNGVHIYKNGQKKG